MQKLNQDKGRAWGRQALLLLALGCFGISQGALAAKLYRYTNGEGVQELNTYLPPEYSQNGYEIVNERGDVLRTVPPALSEEATEALRAERMEKDRQQQWDRELLRRYSSVRDIEAAKKRKLAQVQNSILIIKSNMTNIKGQLAEQHARAAESERQGKDVPKPILQKIDGLERELQSAEEQLAEREQQFSDTEEKYDRDRDRFATIRPDRQ
ncbi:hypothetical protein [Pseudomaricurvus sp. HS19]|uniref:hypothetical protein n=1 Tax=Pseudomaricurvus sp. HS19 TaxID=2692626 RepID=UPI00136EA5C1|nr:hypothetical protein [Pseudomaricurvus sp. HS19]MYM64155.1 hypothetical protein [Pseudomaricurvus sp. HS19]